MPIWKINQTNAHTTSISDGFDTLSAKLEEKSQIEKKVS